MKPLSLTLMLVTIVTLAIAEPPVSKRPLVFHNWPPKNSKQLAMPRNPTGSKQRTLVVQIRSDQPVPLVLKGRPGHAHAHLHSHAHALTHGHHPAHLHHAANFHHANRHLARPIKLSAPAYYKAGSMLSKQHLRKPLKLKLPNSKPKSKPLTSYEKPFQYELPQTTTTSTTTTAAYADLGHLQKLPLQSHAHFISDHFAPIHTIPAPNLALHDNHIHHEDQHEHQQTYHSNNQYQVTEDLTNDHTILDPYSGSQKLFAPDPDPSLPTSKIRPSIESFNQPSNGKPLPADVQSNYLPPVAQPLVQIVGAQQQHSKQPAPEIYPIQFTHAAQQALQLQPFGSANIAAPVPVYSPTYLVTQSNNLYTQHQQQLFKPAASIVEAGYVDADLTQEVASNGQILQAAKDAHNNIHPVLDAAPQFAALIAAPALGEDHHQQHHQAFALTSPFRLTNAAAGAGAAESGFVVSNYFGNAHDSSQLLQAYAEEEAHQQQLEVDQAAHELQQQKHYQQLQLQQKQQHLQQLQHEQEEQQLLLQQQQNHLLELQQEQQHLQQQQQHLQQQQQLHQYQVPQAQQQQQHVQQQQEQQLQQQQHIQQQHIQQQQKPQQQQQQQIQPRQPQQQTDPAAAAFEEHQRLVQQQLGDTPLRIFVPDDEAYADASRIQKRSDNLKQGTVEDADARISLSSLEDSFEVSSSVEVSSEHQRDADREQDENASN